MRPPTQSEPAARDARRHPWRGLNADQAGILPHEGEDANDDGEGGESGEYDESGEYGDTGEYGDSGE